MPAWFRTAKQPRKPRLGKPLTRRLRAETLEARNMLAAVIVDDGDAGFSASLPTLTIDDGSPGYSEAGTWYTSGLGGVDGDSRWANAGATTTYNFGSFTPGTYELRVNTPGHATSTTAAKYTITAGGTTTTQTIDQVPGTSGWLSLGTFAATGGTLSVTVSTEASGAVRADAMQIVPTGGWVTSGLGGYDGDSLWAYQGSASYTFTGLTPGVNDIAVQVPQHYTSTTAALYTITSGVHSYTTTLNQRTSGSGWVSLGSYNLDSTATITVSFASPPSLGDALRADAIRISRPVINVFATDSTINEAGETSTTFVFTRDTLVGSPIVGYQLSGAILGSDYTGPLATTGTITFASNSLEAHLTVTAKQDSDAIDEVIMLDLAGGDYEVGGSAFAEITVVDNGIVGSEDQYGVFTNEILNVSAEDGLLSNDVTFRHASIMVELVTDVQHGVLELFSDGSFSYDPGFFQGETSFSYRIIADGDYSLPVHVSITAVADFGLDFFEGLGWMDLVGDKEIWVGERALIKSDLPLIYQFAGKFKWTVEGNPIDTFVASPNKGEVIPFTVVDQPFVSAAWIDDGEFDVTLDVTIGGVTKSRTATFDVLRPADAEVITFTRETEIYQASDGRKWMQFGKTEAGIEDEIFGITFERTGEEAPSGHYFYVQTMDYFVRILADEDPTPEGEQFRYFRKAGSSVLDDPYPYDPSFEPDTEDAPGVVLLDNMRHYTVNHTFRMYVMWSSTKAGAIPVPISLVTWTWAAEATSTNGVDWVLDSSHNSEFPVSIETLQYPQWSGRDVDLTFEVDD